MSGKELATTDARELVDLEVLNVKTGKMVTASIPAELAERFPSYGGVEEMADLADEVFGDKGGNLSITDLVKVSIPDGKSIAFTIGNDAVKTFEGIVILRQERRNYWEQSVEDGGNQPPNCYSRDAINGVGDYGKGSEENPEGLCEQCPMSQWADGPDEARIPPPCHQQEALLVLVENMAFPLLVTVPRTSLKNLRDYWKGTLFVQRMQSLPEVVTRFGLKKATNAAGTAYNELTFEASENLTEGMTFAQKRSYKLVPLALAEQFRSILLNTDTSTAEPAAAPASRGPVDPSDPDGGSGFSVADDALDDERIPAAG
jgi:hypothetical protein